jgi:hypothetical protein
VAADHRRMESRIVWMCVTVGSVLGGLAPEAWHASGFGVGALLGSAIGAILGLCVAIRING